MRNVVTDNEIRNIWSSHCAFSVNVPVILFQLIENFHLIVALVILDLIPIEAI